LKFKIFPHIGLHFPNVLAILPSPTEFVPIFILV